MKYLLSFFAIFSLQGCFFLCDGSSSANRGSGGRPVLSGSLCIAEGSSKTFTHRFSCSVGSLPAHQQACLFFVNGVGSGGSPQDGPQVLGNLSVPEGEFLNVPITVIGGSVGGKVQATHLNCRSSNANCKPQQIQAIISSPTCTD